MTESYNGWIYHRACQRNHYLFQNNGKCKYKYCLLNKWIRICQHYQSHSQDRSIPGNTATADLVPPETPWHRWASGQHCNKSYTLITSTFWTTCNTFAQWLHLSYEELKSQQSCTIITSADGTRCIAFVRWLHLPNERHRYKVTLWLHLPSCITCTPSSHLICGQDRNTVTQWLHSPPGQHLSHLAYTAVVHLHSGRNWNKVTRWLYLRCG